jgi:hypothetical protein
LDGRQFISKHAVEIRTAFEMIGRGAMINNHCKKAMTAPDAMETIRTCFVCVAKNTG